MRSRSSSSRRRSSPLLGLWLFAFAAAAPNHLLAQITQITSGGQHLPGRRCLTRIDDTQYTVSIDTTGSLELWRLPEGDSTWTSVSVPGGINDTSSGVGAAVPTNSLAIASTSDGVLHVTWGQLSYPSFFQQYYRAIRPATGATVTNVLDVTVAAGATTLSRTDSIDIAAIDNAGSGQPGVYLTAQTPNNWVNALLLIERTGGTWAATPSPTSKGPLSVSASSQTARLAIAPSGTVHATFYNNVGNGNFVHRSFDGTSWGAQTTLGLGGAKRDFAGDVAADVGGTVHAIYNHWLTTTQSQLEYRTLVAGTWSNPVVMYGPPNNVDLDYRFSLTTDTAGNAYVLYFDATDAINYQKATAGVFAPAVNLLPPGLAVPSLPAVRGSVFPKDNRNFCELDVVHRWIPSTPEQLFLQRESVCSCATVGIDVSGSWAPGAFGSYGLSGAAPNRIGVCVLSSDLLSLPVPILSCSCPLFVTPEVLALTLVDAAGMSQVSVPVPQAPVGTTLWAQWLVLDFTLTSCDSSQYAARYVP